MKKTLLLALTASGLMSMTAQAATLRPLAASSAPAALSALQSQPLTGLLRGINGQLPATIGRVGSVLVTRRVDLPGLRSLTLGGLGHIGDDIIVGLGKVVGPPVPPRNDPPAR